MTILLPDGSPWDGTPFTGKAQVVQKAAIGSGVGFWNTGVPLLSMDRTPQALMKRAQLAYHANPWVKLAESVITRKVVGLPWHLEDGEDEEYPEDAPADVQQAKLLLERPQFNLGPQKPATATRRLMMGLTSRHLGLCGMTHWYADQIDIRGVPKAYLYINPARMWASEDAQGNLTGWVLDAKDNHGNGGTPLELEEVLTFYLDPPDWGHYGTGWYEGIVLKAQITHLGDQHAAYVIGTGGRIAGIVSPKEGTIPDEKFNALVKEFRNVNEAPDAAKRTTILQGPVDFTPTAANPQELNLTELSKMNRDDILAVAGVPPTQAGIPQAVGMNSGETKGYDEAVLMQGAVHDRVLAIKETIQYGFLDKYQPTVIELEIEEPEFDDRSPAFALLTASRETPLTNAQRLELVGLPPTGDPAIDNAILLPSTIVQWATAPEEGETTGIIGAADTGDDLDFSALLGTGEELPVGKAAPLALEQDEIDEEITDDGEDDWGDEPLKAGPKYIFGRLNPAYQASASKPDVQAELDAIRKRAEAKFPGRKITDAMVRATYKRNLARRQKQAIAARAKKKFGQSSSAAAVLATLRRNIARDPRLAALFGARAGKAKSDYLGLRQSVDTRVTPALRKSVQSALASQRAEIVKRIREKGAHLAKEPRDRTVWWNEAKERERLTAAIRPHLAGIAETVTGRVTEILDTPKKADNFEERVRTIVADKGGQRITGILETTRDTIQGLIEQGFEDGLSPDELADLIGESTAFDEVRSELIARTETMLAYNEAALGSYAEFGVNAVQAIDGDTDAVCAARNGQVFSLDDAESISDHPNGTLDWVPVFGKAQKADMLPANFSPRQLPEPIREPVNVNVHPPIMPRPPMRLIFERDEYGKLQALREEAI